MDAVDVDGAFVNDVTVTRRAAYFTDSQKAVLYVYPRGGGDPAVLNLTGDWEQQAGFNANGIASTPNGPGWSWSRATPASCSRPTRGRASTTRSTSARPVTNGDGLLLGGARLYVVRNQDHEIAVVRAEPGD